ncbi:MAG: hypothetical protein CME60_13400 [Halobacteriovoraceae bacterium]|nr:hypothetical protein [Halobacteriovoraceae bacterium]|tara:strand:- start:644 stop:1240 length:597 start_codon:yes stop_codon:yes gene_type:complete
MCPNCEKKLSLKKSFLVLSVVALGLFGMESYASDTHGSHDHSKMDHTKMGHSKMKKGDRKSLSEAAKKSIVLALEANEALHSSFFKYDAKAVESNAMKLKKAIDAIEDKEVAKLLDFSKGKLKEIKASNDREANNKNYHLVSMALIHIVNKYDVGSKYNAYSCPMVKKKWVQNSSKMAKVHNPYAPNMPHCGSQDSNH